MKRPALLAICGYSFAGKTRLAEALAQRLGAARVNLDDILAFRGIDMSETIDDLIWEEASWMAMGQAALRLRDGQSVILDDTLSHRRLRDRARTIAARASAGFALIWLDTPLEVCAARRIANASAPSRVHVGDQVFSDHVARFQRPDADEAPFIVKDGVDDIDRLTLKLTKIGSVDG